MTIAERQYTVDEFFAFSSQPENADARFELIEGVISMMTPASILNFIVAGRVSAKLFYFVDAYKLGQITREPAVYELAHDTALMPDAAYISSASAGRIIHSGRFKAAPDLAVEVVSPGNKPRELIDKIELYFRYGTREVWAVYPDEKVVDVWRAADETTLTKQKFGLDDTLSGGDLLPGFALAVRAIFPEITSEE